MTRIKTLLREGFALMRRVPDDLILVLARVMVFRVFWYSGETKRSGWGLSDNALYLFKNEYALPLIPPEVAAWTAMIAEHLFSALIIVGLATRVSALGLLGLTAVIEIFVYPASWPTHGLWAVSLLVLIKQGGGTFALDKLICGKLCGDSESHPPVTKSP